MAKTTLDYHSSAARLAARATLRSIAESAAEQTGRNPHEVLEALVLAQLRKEYSEDPEMLPGARQFELGLHQQDQLRQVTSQVINELCGDPEQSLIREGHNSARLNSPRGADGGSK